MDLSQFMNNLKFKMSLGGSGIVEGASEGGVKSQSSNIGGKVGLGIDTGGESNLDISASGGYETGDVSFPGALQRLYNLPPKIKFGTRGVLGGINEVEGVWRGPGGAYVRGKFNPQTDAAEAGIGIQIPLGGQNKQNPLWKVWNWPRYGPNRYTMPR